MGDDMKDWPLTLRRNAAVCELAAAIYKARGEYFELSTNLREQSHAIREQYVTRADAILKELHPATVVPMKPRLVAVSDRLRRRLDGDAS